MNPISAAAPAATQGANTNSASGHSRDAGEDTQPFANVLRDKYAAADAAKGEPKNRPESHAEADKGKSDKAKAKGQKDDDTTVQAAQDPRAAGTDAILAACMPQVARPEAAVAAAGSEAESSAKPGKNGLGSLLDGRGVDQRAAAQAGTADPRRPLVAGPRVDPETTTAKTLAAALGGKDDAASAGSDFGALIGRLRQEGGEKDSGQNPSGDASTSTLAMLMPANQIPDTQPAAAQRPSTLIHAPVGSPLFADEAAQRVTWLAKNGIEHAEIRVTPPDMGPIQVSIDMKQNEASINFTVAQTDTRVALEDSLHRLEEMLADSGISLAQANIGQRDAGQGQAGDQSGSRSSGGSRDSGRGGSDALGGIPGVASRPAAAMRGLVDTFA
jgi:flagellar hook-length control protein FliK